MNKIILITLLVGSLFISISCLAQEHRHGHGDSAETKSIVYIMQGMDANIQKLTSAIISENYADISSSAHNIANHPGINQEDLHMLFERLGSKKAAFITCDEAVHNLAKEISHAGEQKNMDLVLEKYFDMINKTVECHREYRIK